MKKFNFQDELKQIVDNKQLVEVRFHSAPGTFKVAYILNANDEYLTLIEIAPKLYLDGVCIYRMSDVNSIKVETTYLNKMAKRIAGSTIYQDALKCSHNIQEFSFMGFVSAFEETDTLVEVACENGNSFAGRIISHDDQILVLDEFDKKASLRLAHSYIYLSSIERISLAIPYLGKIAQSLAKKNL